jgi:hypothetical protein
LIHEMADPSANPAPTLQPRHASAAKVPAPAMASVTLKMRDVTRS